MNTAAFKRAGEHGGPIILAAGATSLVMALLSMSRGSPVAAGPAPTTTVTAPPVTVIVNPAPSASVSRSATAAEHTATVAQPVSAASARQPGTGAPSGPTPRPPSSSQPPCAARRALLTLAACLSLGGSR